MLGLPHLLHARKAREPMAPGLWIPACAGTMHVRPARFQLPGVMASLDLGFLELDMLAHDGIVLSGRSSSRWCWRGILLGHIEEAGVSRADQSDLYGGWLRMTDPLKKAALVPAEAGRGAQINSEKMGAAHKRIARFGGPMRESPGFVKIDGGRTASCVRETHAKPLLNHPLRQAPFSGPATAEMAKSGRKGEEAQEARPVADGFLAAICWNRIELARSNANARRLALAGLCDQLDEICGIGTPLRHGAHRAARQPARFGRGL